jgi:predicted site-specific integrase-resolvase
LFKPHHIAPTGYRYYFQEQLNHFLSIIGIKVKNRRIIGYYRVSSSKQKEDDEGVVRE